MRRFAFLIATSACLAAGCAKSPVGPPPAAPSGVSASAQRDTLPPPATRESANTGENGGILIGSGT